jgi:hypothetical protein
MALAKHIAVLQQKHPNSSMDWKIQPKKEMMARVLTTGVRSSEKETTIQVRTMDDESLEASLAEEEMRLVPKNWLSLEAQLAEEETCLVPNN